MKIFAVRIGDKYGPEYEDYLERKLSDYEVHWIREPYDERVTLQWNKMMVMNLDINEPVCVMDIDVLLTGNYKEIFDYPVKRGQFVAMPGWWRDTEKEGYSINGGFFKYYPTDCKYIYDKFMLDIHGWQRHYIDNGVTRGPVNGEQYFVEDSVKEQLKLKLLPSEWVCRFKNHYDHNWLAQLNVKYPGDYAFLDEFNPLIKLVHYNQFNHLPLTPMMVPK